MTTSKKAGAKALAPSPAKLRYVARRTPEGVEEILAGPFKTNGLLDKALAAVRDAGHADAYALMVWGYTNVR